MTVEKAKIDFSKVKTAAERSNEEFSQACTNVRNQRDGLLQEVVWLRDRHRDETDIASTSEGNPTHDIPKTTISDAQYRELIGYIQALRDVPQQEGFPFDVKWPDKPLTIN